MILRTAAGEKVEEAARALSTATRAVYRWRKRFKDLGLEGLKDKPRSGQPVKASEELVQTVLKLTVERIPRTATHWSLRLMAKEAKTTKWQVQQIWKAAALKPRRLKTFKDQPRPRLCGESGGCGGSLSGPAR